MIWKQAAFVIRNICLTARCLKAPWSSDDGSDSDEADRPLKNPFIYLTACPHPPILHACHEARVESLKHSTLDFGVEAPQLQPPFELSNPARTYIH
jgi:2EXR family